jgi:hypothetical protein
MKKTITISAMVLAASIGLQAQTTQVVRWVNTAGGSSTSTTVRVEDAIKAIVEDGNSNTYVIGNYTGTISFQEYQATPTSTGYHTGTVTTHTFTSVSGSQDVFLARYDIDGYCTWCTSIGGSGFDEGNAITMSNPSSPSDFYITGMFNNSMTIGTNTLNKIASGYAVNDAFIIRYNTSLTTSPSPSWWQAFGGYTETCGMGIITSGSNVYITGYYTEYCMDAGSNLILAKTHNDGTSGTAFTTPTPGYLEFPYHDLFVARFSNTGVYSDALHTYGSEDEVEGHGIAISGSDLYVTGTYKGSTKFTTSAVSCSGHSDAFVARYPLTFSSSTAATSVATFGGPSTTYQAAPEEPFYKQDEGYAICATNFGIFATGRFMDQATFGAAGTINPSGSSTETYMYLVRLDAAMSATPVVETGTAGYSEGRGIFGLNGNLFSGTPSTIFVVGGAASSSYINSSRVEANGYTAENVGFIQRIAYYTSTGFSSNANNFVDGIAQNENGLNGTGTGDINVVGFGVSYRVGCAYRIGGRFSSKTAFGNHEKTCSGTYDAFLSERENAVSVTANTFKCGSGSVVLTGTGGTSPVWTGPSGTIGTTASVTVTPTVTTTYTFSATSGSCAASVSPVTVVNYPASSTADAGVNQGICGATTSTVIGTTGLNGMQYSWAPAGSITGATNIAQPTAYVPSGSVTYTMTATDKCGNVSYDYVTVTYTATCIHRLSAPGSAEHAQSSFSVYPNPGNGTFTIETNSTSAKDIFIYDAMGKLVFSLTQTTDASIAVNISGEPKGLYFVRLVNGDEIQDTRIINQ